MSIISLHKETEGVEALFNQSSEIILSSTRSYKLIMLVILLVGFAINWSAYQSINLIDSKELQHAYLIHSWLVPISFLFFCHIFVRTYLKLKIIRHSLKINLLAKLSAFLLLVSVFSFTLSQGVLQLEVFDLLNLKNTQFINEQKLISASALERLKWIGGIVSSLSLYVGWSIFYILWHQHFSKKELKKEMQQAQMQQLTNQLSPHFLFNTFNSIRALIYEDKDKAADTITQLSELFRTHFQAHLRVKSTLQEEWLVSQRYLMIEKLRFEERLVITCDIPDDLLQNELPTLTLLTLIENAIKHGVSPSIDAGFIKISASKISDQYWSLSVSNNFDEKSNTTGTQVGLANIETRLKLMFGEDHNIVQSCQNNEFNLSLELPIA